MMRTTRHTITAIRCGSHLTMGDWEAEYTITFSYLPGSPDTYDASRGGPGGWDPGWGPEIEYISHEPVSDYGPAAENEVEWCKDWLDENAAECAELAEAERVPDPDAARDGGGIGIEARDLCFGLSRRTP